MLKCRLVCILVLPLSSGTILGKIFNQSQPSRVTQSSDAGAPSGFSQWSLQLWILGLWAQAPHDGRKGYLKKRIVMQLTLAFRVRKTRLEFLCHWWPDRSNRGEVTWALYLSFLIYKMGIHPTGLLYRFKWHELCQVSQCLTYRKHSTRCYNLIIISRVPPLWLAPSPDTELLLALWGIPLWLTLLQANSTHITQVPHHKHTSGHFRL